MIFSNADQLELNRRDREDERQAADSKAAAEAALNGECEPVAILTIPSLDIVVPAYDDYRTQARELAAQYGKAVKVVRH